MVLATGLNGRNKTPINTQISGDETIRKAAFWNIRWEMEDQYCFLLVITSSMIMYNLPFKRKGFVSPILTNNI
jgi:hypothetical protein